MTAYQNQTGGFPELRPGVHARPTPKKALETGSVALVSPTAKGRPAPALPTLLKDPLRLLDLLVYTESLALSAIKTTRLFRLSNVDHGLFLHQSDVERVVF